ncbi:MAG: hypothetical protein AB8H47_29450 [Bacteroidia bacterium]
MKHTILTLIGCILFVSLIGQTTFLADPYRNNDNGGSQIVDIAQFNGAMYFGGLSAKRPGLWISDGTESGTQLVASGFQVRELVALNNLMIFSGANVEYGIELWVSDGTASGTVLLRDFEQGPLSGNPNRLRLSGNFVYFSVYADGVGVELWRTDGTTQGTQLVKDISPGLANSNFQEIIPYQSGVAFTIHNGSQLGLWYSDGTDVGTYQVTLPNQGTNPGRARNLKVIDDALYFTIRPANNNELWRTNLTQTDSLTLLGGNYSSAVSEKSFFRFQNDYFYTRKTVNAADTLRLFKTDSLFSTSTLLQEFHPQLAKINELHISPSKILMNIRYQFGGSEVWSSDGFTAQSIRQDPLESNPHNTIGVDSLMLLQFQDGLWRTNGTISGTYKISDFYVNRNLNATANNKITPFSYFQGSIFLPGRLLNSGIGDELYTTDGTSINLIKDIETTPFAGAFGDFIRLDNQLLFSARSHTEGIELWVSDGTPNNTQLLKDPTPGFSGPNPLIDSISINSRPDRFIEHQGFVYYTSLDTFMTNYVSYEAHLWRTDGTVAGTQQLDPQQIAANDGFVGVARNNNKVVFDGRIFLSAVWPDSIGAELFAYDPSINKLELVKDVNTALTGSPFSSSYPQHLTPVGNTLFFSAYTEEEGIELWKSDGTTAGTQMVKAVFPAYDGAFNPTLRSPDIQLIALDSILLFVANSPTDGWELWRSNGTDAGTFVVKDIFPGNTNSNPRNLTRVGNKVFFIADDGTHGFETWVTDGTEVGTYLLADHQVGTGDNNALFLHATNSLLYYRQYDPQYGTELWRTDGTQAGTYLLKDIKPGSQSGFPHAFSETDSTTYFMARGSNGDQIWRTDGTSTGTQLVYELEANDGLFFTSQMHAGSDGLYLVTCDALLGQSLYLFDPANGILSVERPGLQLTAFPNPTQDKVFIKAPKAMEIHAADLYTIEGKTCRNFAPIQELRDQWEFSLQGLSPGYYFLRLQTQEGPFALKIQVQ